MVKGERFNSISHLVGAILTLPAGFILITFSLLQTDFWKIFSFSIYILTLFLLFLFSTLYHSTQGSTKAIFRKLDHISIYLLIAGSYTPFTLISLREGVGWKIFGIIWGLGIAGTVLEFAPKKGKRILPIILYLGMGWLILIPIKSLLQVLPVNGFLWLLAGGLFYTVGAGFYVFSKKTPWFHGLWHIMVMLGCVCHYLTMYLYLL